MEPVHRTFQLISLTHEALNLPICCSVEAISAYLFAIDILAICTAAVVAAVETWRPKWAGWSKVSFELGWLTMFALFELGKSS
jgi:hypothetical protein